MSSNEDKPSDSLVVVGECVMEGFFDALAKLSSDPLPPSRELRRTGPR